MAANRAAIVLVDGVAPGLLDPPCNVLRATPAPEGLSSRILNLDEWFDHILGNLRRQIAVTGDDELRALDRRARAATPTSWVSWCRRRTRRSRAIAMPDAPAHRRRRARVHDDDRDVRHRARHHAHRALDRDVPARRRRDRAAVLHRRFGVPAA